MKFRDRVAVVTGAGSGIGREVALELSRLGAQVALVDVDGRRLHESAEMITHSGGVCSEHIADISVREAVYALPEAVRAQLGEASILVNNAGIILKSTRFDEVPEHDIDRVLAINLLGPLYCTRAFLPQLLAADEAVIVNVSSLAGLVGFIYQVPYATAKFGLRGFTEALRMDLMDTNVRVIPVFPGAIRTNIMANSPAYTESEKQAALQKMEGTRQMPAPVAAKKIIRGIRKGRNRILLGPETVAMDLISRLLPGAYSRLLFKPVKKLLDQSRV
ncbi:SDR family NAD(P)-dependent oxidoreductase [Mycobacterium avium subsp. hominissuis]